MTSVVNVLSPNSGGNYHTTYFPQSTFLRASRLFYCHVIGHDYVELDFKHDSFSEILILRGDKRGDDAIMTSLADGVNHHDRIAGVVINSNNRLPR